jgi:hypothetical protein
MRIGICPSLGASTTGPAIIRSADWTPRLRLACMLVRKEMAVLCGRHDGLEGSLDNFAQCRMYVHSIEYGRSALVGRIHRVDYFLN